MYIHGEGKSPMCIQIDAYNNIYLGAENNDVSICTRGVRAGERRVNPIHKLGLKPVAVGQQEPTVNPSPTPLQKQRPASDSSPSVFLLPPIVQRRCFYILLLRLGCISIVIIIIYI